MFLSKFKKLKQKNKVLFNKAMKKNPSMSSISQGSIENAGAEPGSHNDAQDQVDNDRKTAEDR